MDLSCLILFFLVSYTAVPPLISTDDTETLHSSVEGEKVVLVCEVEGEPRPRVVWEQDGVYLSDLQLSFVSLHDSLLTSDDGVTITKVLLYINGG